MERALDTINGACAVLERFVRFTRELSIIAARNLKGEFKFYPLVQNTHKSGILVQSVVSMDLHESPLQGKAEEWARMIMHKLDYVGVMALELFEVDNNLLANEMAPRVHNSGHWTIEGARTSQFENHLRAILGYPLGDASTAGCVFMQNLIGFMPAPESLLDIPELHYHGYGKEIRPGRKVGHLTLRADDYQSLELKKVELVSRLRQMGYEYC